MKLKAIAEAEALAKASAKVIAIQKEQAKTRLKALGLGGIAIMLASGIMAIGTTEAVAPTKASALELHMKWQRGVFAKYANSDRLSDKQLVELLAAVGFEGQHLRQAWAVAKKETHGNPLAHNGNRKTGDNSYGMFQINMLGSMGDARREQFGLRSNSDLLNPVVNAQVAYYMSKGGKNWSAWKGMTPRTRYWLTKFPYKGKVTITKA